MAFTAIRVSAVLLAAILAAPVVPVAAQARSRTDAQDFRTFLDSIAVRRNARVCARGVPEYAETFDGLYRAWSEKHRAEISRGESIFRDALTKKGPGTDRASLTRVEESLAELAKPPQATGPITLDARTAVACETILNQLKKD